MDAGLSGVAGETRDASDEVARCRRMLEHRFDDFVDTVMQDAMAEMEPLRVVSGARLPGNSAAKSIARPLISREVQRFHGGISSQFDVVLDLAERRARGEPHDFSVYRERFLDEDVFVDSCRDPTIEADLVDRLRVMARDMGMMMETGRTEFWDAAYEAFDESEARELVDFHFDYSSTLYDYRDDLRLCAKVGRGPMSVSVEYTDEALRSISHGEAALRRRLARRVDDVF
ncbi:MAG: hypothetical protein ACOCT0_00050 [Halobacteriota archaeon]